MSGELFTYNTGIDDAEVEQVREWIGVPLRVNQFNREVTVDAIRHYAHGLGDDNPLWCDEDYGRASVYGSVIAPPTFLYAIWSPGVGPGFPGLQAFHAGSRWEFERPLKPGERLTVEPKMTDLKDVTGRRAGRMLIQEGETVYRTAAGEVVGRNISRAFRIPRPDRGGLSYEPRPPQSWTTEELDEFDAKMVAYRRRGATPRYLEDVAVGEALDERVKGPLALGDILAYYAGNFSGGYLSTDMAARARFLAANDPDKLPNNRPVELRRQRTEYGQGHQDARVAAAVGMPGVYDNGWLRIGWVQQVVTDWAGDAAFVKSIESKLFLPNVIGDVVRFSGRVAEKLTDESDEAVRVEVRGERHDGELSIEASAVVVLPRRADG